MVYAAALDRSDNIYNAGHFHDHSIAFKERYVGRKRSFRIIPQVDYVRLACCRTQQGYIATGSILQAARQGNSTDQSLGPVSRKYTGLKDLAADRNRLGRLIHQGDMNMWVFHHATVFETICDELFCFGSTQTSNLHRIDERNGNLTFTI